MLAGLADSLYKEPTARLAEESILRIRSEGFIISAIPNFGPDHMMPNGYLVFRPIGIIGNSLQGNEAHFTDETGKDHITDGPSPIIYSKVADVIRYLKGTHEKFKERLATHNKR